MDLPELILQEDDIDAAVFSTFFDDSDSSSSSNDEIFLLGKRILDKSAAEYAQKNYYINEFENYSDEFFTRSFRLNRKTALKLIEGFKHSDVYKSMIHRANSRVCCNNAEKTVLAFLWFAGHQNQAYRDIAKHFNLSTGALFRIISNVSEYLNSIAHEVIKWPNEKQQYLSKTHYYTSTGIPNVIGCIGNISISITRPLDGFVHLWDSYEHFLLVLQAVCNEQKKFIDIFVSSPGVTEDDVIFKNSPVCKRLTGNQMKDSVLVTSNIKYPLLNNLITPYVADEETLLSKEIHFNKKLDNCCSELDQTFHLLKRRFKQLYHVKLRDPIRNINFIKACCVLHNIADEEDYLCFEDEEEMEEDVKLAAEVNGAIFLSPEGSLIREKICDDIYKSIKNEDFPV